MTKTKGQRLQIRVSDPVAEQVDALAAEYGISQSAMGSMLIVAGLARLRDVLGDTQALAKLTASELEKTRAED